MLAVPEEVPEAIRALSRAAFVPVTGAATGEVAGSRFGGAAAVDGAAEHPVCGSCQRPLALLVQLDLRTLPQGAPFAGESALLQVFYCCSSDPNCEDELDAWEPYSKAHVVRLVPVRATLVRSSADAPGAPPEKAIVDWRTDWDVPNWEELEAIGVAVDDEAFDLLDSLERPLGGDKLGGWPAWVQGVEYPSCTTCGATMLHVLQIDSEDNLPIMFGDVGTAHVTRCGQHPDIMTLAWACC